MVNEFTNEELLSIEFCIQVASGQDSSIRDSMKQLHKKILSMIDNHNGFNVKEIAKSHLIEADSYINHAMSLLGMKDE